jgi:CheY-like chemotaxis protein
MAKKYLLLAEDDPDDQEALRLAFIKEIGSIEIECVADGVEMLAHLNNCSPDKLPSIILMDYHMPVKNADDILKDLSADNRLSHIPKLVWSTSDRSEYMDRCISAGALRYIHKPSTLKELHEIAASISGIMHEYGAEFELR